MLGWLVLASSGLALLDGEGHPFAACAIAGDGVDAHLDLTIDPGLGALVVDAVILVERLDDPAIDTGQILACPRLRFVLLVFHLDFSSIWKDIATTGSLV